MEHRKMPAQKQDILSPWEKLRNGFSSACRGSGQVQSQHNCVLPYCLGRASFTSSLECLENPNHRREGMWGRTCSFWFPEILSLHIQLLLRTSGSKPGLTCRGPAEVGMFFRFTVQSHYWRGSGKGQEWGHGWLFFICSWNNYAYGSREPSSACSWVHTVFRLALFFFNYGWSNKPNFCIISL